MRYLSVVQVNVHQGFTGEKKKMVKHLIATQELLVFMKMKMLTLSIQCF